MTVVRRLLGALLCAWLVAACSGSAAVSARSEPTPAATATATPTATPGELTAAGVVGELRARGLPVTLTVIYSAQTDPEALLGRPHGYTSKVSFVALEDDDSGDADAGEFASGGGVEVFASAADARARSTALQRRLQDPRLSVREYHYLAGRVLIRVAGGMTPELASAYRRAATELGAAS